MRSRDSVLFVCLGNICRSPLARGVFVHLAAARGVEDRFDVASAGTGHWHVGRPPDERSSEVARRRGIVLRSRAQQVDVEAHFARFHWLIGMDADNCARLRALGAPAARVRLLRSFDPALAGEPERRLDVPDPYYGGPEGFERVFDMIHAACAGLLEHLLKESGRS